MLRRMSDKVLRIDERSSVTVPRKATDAEAKATGAGRCVQARRRRGTIAGERVVADRRRERHRVVGAARRCGQWRWLKVGGTVARGKRVVTV